MPSRPQPPPDPQEDAWLPIPVRSSRSRTTAYPPPIRSSHGRRAASNSVVATAAEPASDRLSRLPPPASDSVVATAAEPASDSVVETAAEPASDSAVETAAEPASDAVVETAAEPSARSDHDAPFNDLDLVVAMRGVSRRFEDRVVLSGVDLAVPRGTILGIIGPSGAGKTTTIRMLTGALAPTSGDVSVLGRDPRKFRRSERERIGYMPQQFTLYDDLTAGENIDFVASLFGMLWRRRRRRVKEVLHVVDLWDARGRQAGRLSGGMQRRLELACALVHEPDLIILDEPTAGIDPLLRGTIWDELHRLRDSGRTLLVTTQHVSEADECDAVAMIVGGEIVALAAPEKLRRLATHGDLLDIETSALFDGSDLVGLTGVGEITQDGPRHFRVVVADAGRPCRSSSRRSRRPASRSSRPASIACRSTRSSRSWWPVTSATATRARPTMSRAAARTRRQRHEPVQDADPDPRDRRQGARLDHAPAGRAAQPHPRTLPDHGPVRIGLQRLPPAPRYDRRHPGRNEPSDRRPDVPGGRRRRAPDRRGDRRRGARR